MKTPYGHADKALKRLKGVMESEFQNFSTSFGFDELNYPDIQKRVSDLYNRIDTEVRSELQDEAEQVWEDTENEIGVAHEEFASAAFLIALLKGFNRVSKYVYTREWTRKRDRLVESLMASGGGNQEIRQALQRALNLMIRQVRQYADNVTDEAREQVFAAAGISEVMWNAQKDAVTCKVCSERDGQVYRLGEVPDKHPRCRCFLTAVRKD